jgi:hypothetical protein
MRHDLLGEFPTKGGQKRHDVQDLLLAQIAIWSGSSQRTYRFIQRLDRTLGG